MGNVLCPGGHQAVSGTSTVLPDGTILVGNPGSVLGGIRPPMGTVKWAMRSIIGNKVAMAPFRRDWTWLVPNGGDVRLLTDTEIVAAIIRRLEAGQLHAYYQRRYGDGPADQLVSFLSGIFGGNFVAEAEKAGFGETPWGRALLVVLRSTELQYEFQLGLAEGALQGLKNFITGVAMLIGKTVQLGLDSGLLGYGGDYARGLTGKLPGWLDEIVPSKQRSARTIAQVSKVMDSIKGYVVDRANNPGQVAEDIKDAFNKIWASLEAQHAAAARKGPGAEARWWGYIVGLVVFEIALTFVPVAGMAGKANKAAKVADKASDASKVKPKPTAKPKPKRSPKTQAALDKMSPEFRREYEAAEAAGWKYPPDHPKAGQTWYPPNNGGVGDAVRTNLPKDMKLDRFGGEGGSYLSKAGDTFDSRALPGMPDGAPNIYSVTEKGAKRLLVEQSEIAPWFGQPGGGMQYKLIDAANPSAKFTVADAIQSGLLKRGP